MHLAKVNIVEGVVDMYHPQMKALSPRIDAINTKFYPLRLRWTSPAAFDFKMPISALGKPITPNYPEKDHA